MKEYQLEDFFKVGWVKDAHGLRGELYVKLLSKEPEWLSELDQALLHQSATSTKTLVTVKKWKPHKQGLIIHVEGISNRNQSEELKGYEFLIPKQLLSTEEGEVPYLVEFLGFEVVDQKLGSVGKVIGFVDNGAQDLIEVEQGEKTHLIPFVDAFINAIDKSGKTLKMDLPEGLIE